MSRIKSIDISWNKSAKMIAVGPKTSAGQLVMPKMTTAKVGYENGIYVRYVFRFTDNKLKLILLEAMNVSGGINTYDLVQMEIPAIAKTVVEAVNSEVISKLSVSTKEGLAQAYMSEYICGGAPRKLLMEMTGWSRSNSNFHIRNLEKLGLIPEYR